MSPITQRKLSAAKLALAIRHSVTDPLMQRRAVELAARINAEDGVGNAIDSIAEYVAAGQQSRVSQSES